MKTQTLSRAELNYISAVEDYLDVLNSEAEYDEDEVLFVNTRDTLVENFYAHIKDTDFSYCFSSLMFQQLKLYLVVNINFKADMLDDEIDIWLSYLTSPKETYDFAILVRNYWELETALFKLDNLVKSYNRNINFGNKLKFKRKKLIGFKKV